MVREERWVIIPASEVMAILALASDAADLEPSLVQTLEGGPAIVHAGPFSNIAHGCNSLVATRTALALERGLVHLDHHIANVQQFGVLAREVLALLEGRTADGVDITPSAARSIEYLESIGVHDTPVCIAKTQYSLTDGATKLGVPRGFRITINEVYGSAGAGFVAAEKMRLRPDGTIEGLS